MSRTCQITGRGTTTGRSIARRGLAKAKGGVGIKTTGITKRKFKVNLHDKRLWVPELGQWVRVKVSSRGLRTITKKGLLSFLRSEGLQLKDVTR